MNKFDSPIHDELVRKSRNYKAPTRAIELVKEHKPLIVAGVTASGKNAIISYVVQRASFERVITHTTRPPRSKEQSGEDYWFVSEPQMLKLIDAGALIETQAIHGDTVYGTSFAAFNQVIKSGHHPILEIDIQGITELAELIPTLEPIFILPPSFDVWMERLGGRDAMSDGERQRRLRSARIEIEEVLRSRKFVLIVNHEVDDTAHQIMTGISGYAYDQTHAVQLAQELIEYLRVY